MRASHLIVAIAFGASTIIVAFKPTSSAAQSLQPQELVSNISLTNITLPHFSPLLPPLNRAVTPGLAWVYPSSPNDLGARSMSCECFDPGDQCCMPTSKLVAPYCMPTGSICCGNTFCMAGETCCGDFCCATNTTCNLNIYTSGCCPTGSICPSLMTCYDASSPNCTNTITPAQQCCPADMPYCRDFAPNGLGCYASSVVGTTSTMSGMEWGMNAAPTSVILGLGAAQTTASGETHMTTSTLASIKTVTVSVVSNKSGGMSLDFPSLTKAANGTNQSTTYILEYPSSDIAFSTPTSKALHPEETSMVIITGSEVYATVYSTTTSSAASSSSTIASSNTNKSPLCFNTILQTPAPCPSSTTTTPSPTTNSALPSTSPSSSQANSMRNLPSPIYALLITIYILSSLVFLGLLLYTLSYLLSLTNRTNDAFAREFRDTLGLPIKDPSIEVVPGSGRRLSSASVLGREISIVRETGRVYKEPMVVDKGSICVVEGSGHWIEGFSEKDAEARSFMMGGSNAREVSTKLASGAADESSPLRESKRKPAGVRTSRFNYEYSDGNLTLMQALALGRNEPLDTQNQARFLKVLERKRKGLNGEASVVKAEREMAQSESTSSLAHIFLGSRDNA